MDEGLPIHVIFNSCGEWQATKVTQIMLLRHLLFLPIQITLISEKTS